MQGPSPDNSAPAAPQHSATPDLADPEAWCVQAWLNRWRVEAQAGQLEWQMEPVAAGLASPRLG